MRAIHKFTVNAALLVTALLLWLAGPSCYQIQPPSPPPLPPTPSHQEDTTPPETTLTRLPAEKISYNNITFEWLGDDDSTPTAELTYSYFLEGYDPDYSPFTSDTSKTYADLPAGSYTFYVKARDSASNVDPSPAMVKFVVEIPKPEPEKEGAFIPVPSHLLIVPGGEVNHIAVTYNNVVYALDSINARLYKSEPGGINWKDISGTLGAAPLWSGLAVAPDDHRIIAVVTDSGKEVYISTNGGNSFSSTGLGSRLSLGERITCLAISPSYGETRWEVAAGTSTGSGAGRVWTNMVSAFPGGWHDMSSGAAGWLPAPISGVDVFALKYSPNFAADLTLLAIVASKPPTEDTYLYIGTRDLGGNATQWNTWTGYPLEICQSGQDTPGTPLTYADMALPADYSGATPWHRHVYACWSDNPPGVTSFGNPDDGVYRLDDTVCYRILTAPDVICSLAHYGIFSRGKLLAGAAISTQTGVFRGPQVYFAPDPFSSCPTWQKSQKPPTGPGQARVAWSPDGNIAYCGTSSTGISSHDQSAFSVSTNNGLTWNQTGLIDL